MMQVTVQYWDKAGPANTDATLALAFDRARTLGIKQIVVASSHGYTARKAAALFRPAGMRVIAVTLCHGYEHLGWCMEAGTVAELRGLGVEVVTGIHALGDGVGAAFSEKRGGYAPEEMVRETLYRFSQGAKVAVEDLLMAADAGLLDMNQEVITIAGTSEGADTALVCKPAYPRTFLELEIREVLCKPRVP